MENYKTKSVLVYDNGLFVELAVTLSKYFGKTYYYFPWESGFPRSNDMMVGKGIPGVTRIDNVFEMMDDIDLFVFPDVYSGDIQVHLEKLGKRVFGSRFGDELELYREESKAHCSKLGINVGKYTTVIGIDALREYLKKHDNQYVKVSFTRGDFETFHSENYKNIEPKLDELEHNLGAKKKVIKFMVEEAIDDAVEIGYDGYCIDGIFPTKGMWGIEVKDRGYVGVFRNYNELPMQIRDINKRMSGTLKDYGYRNFFSTEVRVKKDGTAFSIDPCCRAGSPPSELYQNLYSNIADIVWQGSMGKCIDPIPTAKYGAELIVHAQWADKNWQAVEFPAKLRDNIKLRNLTVINGEHYVVPQSVGLPEIGAVVATGNTLEEAIAKVTEYAKQIKGYFIDVFPEALNEAQEEIEKLKTFGIKF